MIYYKGYIVRDTFIKNETKQVKIGYDKYSHISNIGDIDLFYNNLPGITDNQSDLLKRFIFGIIKKQNPQENEKLHEYFQMIYELDIKNQLDNKISSLGKGFESFIVYELVKDKDDNLFGKELYTGELFPIYNSKCQLFNYYITLSKLEDGVRNEYTFKITPDINVTSLLKCGQIIVKHEVADKNDIEKYKNMFNKKRLFKKKNLEDEEQFKKYIIGLANQNIFKEDFSLEKKEHKVKKLESQSIETTLMEEIEFNLISLKSVDENLYREYRDKYENLLNTYINKETLAILLGEIEFSLIFKKRDIEDILEVINNFKKEYLDNLINKSNNKTDLDLKKLDKINELFLKVKNRYDYKSQRSVLNNLAFLYLMEVIENIDTISLDDLDNSYFKTHLKSIIIWIKLLIECDIIECSYIINLRDDITSEVVLDVIKSIKFMHIDNEKIKRIGELQWI